MADLVLFPGCDLHVALQGAPQLRLALHSRATTPTVEFSLGSPVTNYQVAFFAPYKPEGSRLGAAANLPSVDPSTGLVTATHPGVYLFQLKRGNDYLVGRLQVHQKIVDWWFGNESITTAVHGTIAHSQPSIYARFEDPAGAGTDLTGDITGHGYVTLTPTNVSVFDVNAHGRLRGVSVSPTPVNLNGNFLSRSHDLQVRVVDYAQLREDLVAIQARNIASFAGTHNMVFIPEGFRAQDDALFNQAVTTVVSGMFDKPRHQPYPMLEGSINVFKAFAASRQHLVTTGYRVTSAAGGGVPEGSPIPYPNALTTGGMRLGYLISKVGLPKRGETDGHGVLVPRWKSQKLLTDQEAAQVTPDVVEAWRKQQSEVLLDARDTLFGLILGSRWGERDSAEGPAPVPAGDDGSAALIAFVKQLHEFYEPNQAIRSLRPDARRHPPELWDGSRGDGMSILTFLDGLKYRFGAKEHIGPVWVPPTGVFSPSRGLVAIIAHDGIIGGSAFNSRRLTATALNRFGRLSFTASGSRMRRDPPDPIPANLTALTNTVAHEFGHSFALGDEYEMVPGDHPDASLASEPSYDNLTRLGVIRFGAAPSAQIDHTKVKWIDLPRIAVSSALVENSVSITGGIRVKVARDEIAAWAKAKADGKKPSLRQRRIGTTGLQLPLLNDAANLATQLTIDKIQEATGTIELKGSGAPYPVFVKDSLLFLQLESRVVTEPRVLIHLGNSHRPLNEDKSPATKVNRGRDTPESISDYSPPCRAAHKAIGVYEGGLEHPGGVFRPAGSCKMRLEHASDDDEAEFCHVCKWLIVNRVNPSLHALLDKLFYPKEGSSG